MGDQKNKPGSEALRGEMARVGAEVRKIEETVLLIDKAEYLPIKIRLVEAAAGELQAFYTGCSASRKSRGIGEV